MCTSPLSASEGEGGEIFTFRQDLEERVEEETLLLPDGVKHPSE